MTMKHLEHGLLHTFCWGITDFRGSEFDQKFYFSGMTAFEGLWQVQSQRGLILNILIHTHAVCPTR